MTIATFDLNASQEQIFWAAFCAVISLTIGFRMFGERRK